MNSAPIKKFSEEDLQEAKNHGEAGWAAGRAGFQESGMDVANRLLNSSILPWQRLTMNIPDVTNLYDMPAAVEEADDDEDDDNDCDEEADDSKGKPGKPSKPEKKPKWWNSDASIQSSLRTTQVKIQGVKDMLSLREKDLTEQIELAKSADTEASNVEVRIASKLLEGVSLVLGSDSVALNTYIEKFSKCHKLSSVCWRAMG